MAHKLLDVILKSSQKEHALPFRVSSLLLGATVFLIIIPWVLITLLSMVDSPIGVYCPRSIEIFLGFMFNALGLFLAFWSLASLWLIGEGTPVPIVPSQHLVVEGPYKLCRNPMKLGAICYYLGLGTLFDSLTTGLLCFFVGLIIGTFYHKLVEEKELLIRFGEEYDDYKKSTPFVIPRWPW